MSEKLRFSDRQFDALLAVLTRIADSLYSKYVTYGSAPRNSGVGASLRPPAPVTNTNQSVDPHLPKPQFSFSESGEEHEAAADADRELAQSLGVAPWSPDFQSAITEYRNQLMTPRKVQVLKNEETNEFEWIDQEFTRQEADEIIRQGFQLARAEANVRIRTGKTGAVTGDSGGGAVPKA